MTPRFEAVSAVLLKIRLFRDVRPRLWASGFDISAAQLAIKTNGNTRQTTRRLSP